MATKNLTPMNDIQTKVARMINEICKSVIGDYQIGLDENPAGSPEWQRCNDALEDYDSLCAEILEKFRAGHSGWLKQSEQNTHFVKLIWVRAKIAERVNYYLS